MCCACRVGVPSLKARSWTPYWHTKISSFWPKRKPTVFHIEIISDSASEKIKQFWKVIEIYSIFKENVKTQSEFPSMEVCLWKNHRQRSEVSTTQLRWSVKCFQQCIIAIRCEIFALQRLAKLLKFTRSQICTAWDSYRAALSWHVLNDKMESRVAGYWHGLCRAALRVFGWPFLVLLTEIKLGSAPGRAFFFFFSAFEGWLDFAPVGSVAATRLHHHCRSESKLHSSPGFTFSAAIARFLYLTCTFQLFTEEG